MEEKDAGKYKKVKCPKCGGYINFATMRNVNYDLREADNRVWCPKCGRYVKFSIIQD